MPALSAFASAIAVINASWPPAATQIPDVRDTDFALDEQVHIVTSGSLLHQ